MGPVWDCVVFLLVHYHGESIPVYKQREYQPEATAYQSFQLWQLRSLSFGTTVGIFKRLNTRASLLQPVPEGEQNRSKATTK
jgi:hypothetical protein